MSQIFTPRAHRRVKTRCALQYYDIHVNGTGTVHDMSLAGWRVVGDQRVIPGALLSFRILLPLTSNSIEIELAIVQWVKGREFGLRTINLSPSTEAAIKAYLSRITESASQMQQDTYLESRHNDQRKDCDSHGDALRS